MTQVNLLRSLPKAKRDINARASAKSSETIWVARQFGKDYFDGDRKYGYGGYRYDGRWRTVAADIVEHYSASLGRILDVGCAKGFLVKEFMMSGAEWVDAYGIDISSYAITHCEPEVVGRLHIGNAVSLPFPDKSFDLVVSINTLHNLPIHHLIPALKEIMRVSKGPAFVQVDSYHTPEQKKRFEDWVLTAQFHDYPEGWLRVFAEAGYTGDYDFTVVE